MGLAARVPGGGSAIGLGEQGLGGFECLGARVEHAYPRSSRVYGMGHQAVEKGLKALYIERYGTLPPRTHDLNFLARQLAMPTSEMHDVAAINPAFDLVRYPDPVTLAAPVDSISPQVAAQHLAGAERILKWIGTQLP